MASVILKTAASAVGNAFLPGIGGQLFGMVGAGLGGVIDGQLGLGSQATGPRLDNLSVQDSRYGAGIPIIYGSARVAGNVIWSTNLIETQHNSSVGGKGGVTAGVSTTTYTYSVHVAVGICSGPIGGINTIWADSTVIYQQGVWSSNLFDGVTIYTGAAGQSADGFMQSILGAGNVPAYQGLAYIVFDNLQLSSFGNRLPNLTFEIAPPSTSDNPVWLGSTDAGISQRLQAAQSGTMLPINLSGSAVVQSVLVGGYKASGSNVTFTVATYDVSADVPLQLSRNSSAAFSASAPLDCAWALSPDGRFIAMYLQNSSGVSHNFCLYDSVAQSFGAVYSTTLAASSTIKQIVWIDAQHFVIDDSSGGVRGLHVFARSGTGIIDLGFTQVWGSGSASSTSLFYGAQFTPYADGLLAYTTVVTGLNIVTLQARLINWRNNKLAVGAAFNVATGLTLGTGSGPHARFVQSAAGEWTLVFGTVVNTCLMSFEPSSTAAVVTRGWTNFTLAATGTTQFPMFYGDRILLAQRVASQSNYCLSEILLTTTGFTLSVDSAAVSGGTALDFYFAALRLDSGRYLLMGVGGFYYNIGQLAIIRRNQDGSVAAIVSDILSRAGYAAGDSDVSALADSLITGYVLQDPTSARHAIEPLQAYTPFDLIETAGQLKAVLRGGDASATLPSSEARAALLGKTQPPALLTVRSQEMDLPREVCVDAIDPSRNYEVNSQRARRIATSAKSTQKITLPIVCSAGTAKQIAERLLFTAWAERNLIKLSVSRAWLALDPSDVVDLGNGNLLRVTSITQSGGLVQIEGFYSYAASLDSAAVADGGQAIIASASAPVASILYLLDLPLLHATDDQPGVYVAASGLTGWRGATVMRSSDGASYSAVAQMPLAASCGIATSVLSSGSALYPDNANSVTVQMSQDELSSCGWIDLTTGSNAALLGNEIIQFQTATLIGPGLYRLSNLLRGRRGTESATTTHAIGEAFVLLQAGTVDFLAARLSDRGATYDFRALTTSQSLSDAQDYAFTYGMRTLCPLSPVLTKAARSGGTTGDLTLTWARRARLNAEWVDYIDVPLDEAQELYEVDVMNGAAVMRAFTGLTAPTVTYTAAQQTADWGGSVPATFTINLYQISSRYGNGAPGTAVL
jgi:hypothetical protein